MVFPSAVQLRGLRDYSSHDLLAKISRLSGVTTEYHLGIRGRGECAFLWHKEASGLKKKCNFFESSDVEALASEIVDYLYNTFGCFQSQAGGDIPKESNQGETTQQAEVEQNTAITRDEDVVIVKPPSPQFPFNGVCSSIPVNSFSSLTSRWMGMETIPISPSSSGLIKVFRIPFDLFNKLKTSTNLLPFESFVYNNNIVEFLFIVNGNRFSCGKLICSYILDSFQIESSYNIVATAVQRPHVILDLSTNNEGILKVPFIFRRNFIRSEIDSKNIGVNPAQNFSLFIHILSPLNIGKASFPDISLRIFFRFVEVNFTGMSYRLVPQAGGVLSLVLGSLSEVLRVAERFFTQLGRSRNQDKPSSVQFVSVVPQPRLGFGSSRGVSDAIPLKFDPSGLTSFPDGLIDKSCPVNALEIARIWGLRTIETVSTKTEVGSEVFSFTPDPTFVLSGKATKFDGVPTPLAYMCGLYSFWGGSIEYRLDFVSNSFHTGTFTISAEFLRPTQNSKEGEFESLSTYFKTFHLGDQKSVNFTVPFIFDNPYHRTRSGPFNPMSVTLMEPDATATQTYRRRCCALVQQNYTRLVVRLTNGFRPVDSVSQEIEILVFERAGEDFRFLAPCQSSFVCNSIVPASDNFPEKYGEKSSSSLLQRGQVPHHKVSQDSSVIVPIPTSSLSAFNLQLYLKRQKEEEERRSQVLVSNSQSTVSVGKKSRGRHIQNFLQSDSITGSTDSQDPTYVFPAGEDGRRSVVSEDHSDLISILKRPVFLSRAVVLPYKKEDHKEGDYQVTYRDRAFYIPVQPVSASMSGAVTYTPATATGVWTENSIYNWSCVFTPQAAIANMYRFWRGSMRYTIISHSRSSMPLYVTHMPHSGVRIRGNYSATWWNTVVTPKLDFPIIPPYSTGLFTQMIIPSVNPSITVEVPYYSENLWTLMQEENGDRNYCWRDKGDTNSGHLLLSSEEEHQVSVWCEVGDDFEVAGFLGVPKTLMLGPAWIPNDNHPSSSSRVNSEVKFQSPLDSFSDWFNVIRRPVGVALMSTIPFVGPTLASGFMYYNILDFKEKADTTIENINTNVSTAVDSFQGLTNDVNSVCDSLNPVLGKVGEVCDATSQTFNLINSVFDYIKSKFSSLFSMDLINRILNSSFHIVLDIVSFIRDKCWNTLPSLLSRLFYVLCGSEIFQNSVDFIVRHCTIVSDFIRQIYTSLTNVVFQMDGYQTVLTVASSLISLFCLVYFNLTGRRPDIATAQNSRLGDIISQVLSYRGANLITVLTKLFSSVLDFFYKLLASLFSNYSPETRVIQQLTARSSFVKSFIAESQSMLSELNSEMLVIPSVKMRFWINVLRAYKIQQCLSVLPNNLATPVLNKLCCDVIKLGNEKILDISSSPVRYEPFVICVEGAPGIGKSSMTEKLITEVLSDAQINLGTGEMFYYVQPGSKFWNGYKDQPVVIYDDWLNINEPEIITKVLNDLYRLKSTSVFIPEMAELNDKKIRANPFIIVLLCNNAYPDNIVKPYVSYPEAVYRRRDLVIQAKLKGEYSDVPIREIDSSILDSCDHLKFTYYPDSKKSVLNPRFCSYSVIKQFISSKFKEFHTIERRNVRKRMERLFTNLGCAHEIDKIDVDPFSLFRSFVSVVENDQSLFQNVLLPTERLKMEIDTFVATLENVPTVESIIADLQVVTPQNLSDYINTTAMYNMLTRLVPIRFSPINLVEQPNCIICYDEHSQVQDTVVCENGHWWCSTCTEGMVANSTSGELSCPMCRSVNVGSVNQRLWNRWLTIYAAFKREGLELVCSLLLKGVFVALPVVILTVPFARSVGWLGTAFRCSYVYLSFCVCANRLLYWYLRYYHPEMFEDYVAPALHRGPEIDMSRVSPEMLERVYGTRPPRTSTLNPNVPPVRAVSSLILSNSDVNTRFVNQPTLFDNDAGGAYLRDPRTMADLPDSDSHPPIVPQGPGKDDDELDDSDASFVFRPSTPVPSTSSLSAESEVFPISFNAQVIEEWSARVPEVAGDCQHQGLFSCGAVAYMDGSWIYSISGVSVKCSVTPCSLNCALIDVSKYRSFCANFFTNNSVTMRRNMMSALNTDAYHNVLSRIPKFMVPSWFRKPEEAPSELTQVLNLRWYDYLPNSYKGWLKLGGALVACCGVGFMFARLFFGNETNTNIVNVVLEGDSPSRGEREIKHVRKTEIRRVARKNYTPQSGDDVLSAAERKVFGNMVTIAIPSPSGIKLFSGFGVCGHYMIFPKHSLRVLREAWEKDLVVTFTRSANYPFMVQRLTKDSVKIIEINDNDISFIKLPSSSNLFYDIRCFVPTQDHLYKMPMEDGRLLIPPTNNDRKSVEQLVDLIGFETCGKVSDLEGNETFPKDTIAYNYSQLGACGSALFAEKENCPLIGMHIAGAGHLSEGRGFSIGLCKEMFNVLDDKLILDKEEVVYQQATEASVLFEEDVVVQYIGKCDKRQHVPVVSKIIPSFVAKHFPFPSPRIPAPMSARDSNGGSPLKDGCSKHGKLTKNFSLKDLEKVAYSLHQYYLFICADKETENIPLSDEITVLGIDGKKYYDPLPMSTSPGFPWSCDNIRKTSLISIEESEKGERKFIDFAPSLREAINNNMSKRKQGIVPDVVFVDMLKDETRSRDKALKRGGTRIICMSPLDLTLSMRAYYLPTIAVLMKERLHHNIMVGINPDGCEWGAIYRRLSSVSFNNCITLDYSNFGPGFNAGVGEEAFNIINKLVLSICNSFEEESVLIKILESFKFEHSNSLHLCVDLLYRQRCGSPSGSPMTVIVNSFVNLLYLLLAWNELVVKKSNYVLSDFFVYTCSLVYGDDCIITVSDSLIDKFNGVTITNFFASYGVAATNAEKSKAVVEKQKLSEAVFLKRKFKSHPFRENEFLAPIDEESIRNCACWIWRTSAPRESSRVNCEQSLRLAYSHGPVYFNKWRSELNRVLLKERICGLDLDWDDLDYMVFEKHVDITGGFTEKTFVFA